MNLTLPRHPLLELASLGNGRHNIPKADLCDLYAPWVREIDPEIYLHVGSKLPTLAEAPDHSGFDLWPNGYRRLSNDLLVPKGAESVDQMIANSDGWLKELLRGLRVDEDNIAIPVGLEEIALFAIMVGDSRHIVHIATPTIDNYMISATVAWTNPGTGYRFYEFSLLGGGGGGGGGARATTLGNQAAGGGGGGGGGYIGRVGNMSSLSNGNVVIAALAAGTGVQATANTNGNTPVTNGNDTTFAGLTAGGGGKGTGGTQGAGAQTGSPGSAGAGDIAGLAGGTGRADANAGDAGGDATTGPAGAGGGGGGGATAETAQAAGGRGGHGWYSAGLHGTTAGGAAGAVGGSNGTASATGGGGGGGGANVTNQSGGSGATEQTRLYGNGGGGAGGRARNASNQAGNGGDGGSGGQGYASIIGF